MSGEARRVEDSSELCHSWRGQDGCRLDQHFSLTESGGRVYSREMFDMMQRACPQSCGWVPSGCHDEHPQCEAWARRGGCVTSSLFMAHTCRETCGVCGFLSPQNTVG